MIKALLRIIILSLESIAVIAVVSSHPAFVVADDNTGLRVVQSKSTVSILDGNRSILRYRYAGAPMKPYADQLFSPSGVQILQDSPHDHRHHHGLMYALAVDGVNFWEEHGNDKGKELHKSLHIEKVMKDGPVTHAGFIEELEWVGPGNDKPLLLEQRMINVLQVTDINATLISWRCHLQTPHNKNASILGGQHYFGLGMRFLPSMDKSGHFFIADDKTGEIIQGGDIRLTSTKWCAYTAKANDKPVTVVIFDHSDNIQPAKMFTMAQPFAYLSATLNLKKKPFTLTVNKPLDLYYVIALWDGEFDRPTVELLHGRLPDISASIQAR